MSWLVSSPKLAISRQRVIVLIYGEALAALIWRRPGAAFRSWPWIWRFS
jgi:hypothetical protein